MLKSLAAVAALAAATGSILLVPGSANAKDAKGTKKWGPIPTATCKEWPSLTDVLLWQKETIPPGEGLQIGTDTIYHDKLVDPTGATVGYEDGRITVIQKRASDGHFIGWIEQTATIGKDEFKTSGLLDMTEVIFHGGTGHMFAVGTRGAYKGWVGDWTLKVEAPTVEPKIWQAHDTVNICKINR
ncbi:allene oxide cyclase barrel-like domain-containing protein [Actinomadura rayongensis]|uniref:Allene oxide cyclase barrel-like domain-containing protein n=1 Tax=Actinomadura rayongensis TaxID=1429076 RepID=A0A6I4WC81_9ACTN|nr:hypothetical protein [Actinomadura rayongensis]MXQ67201.1 hypothetical protein [Actinomadura rayongensis]